jgi:tetratricopeptide (TPR) repeat protein
MAMLPTSPDAPPDRQAADDRLDSWKEIAAYLRRDVSTVQRWEKHEGLPVRRHLHRKIGSVYAYRFEIDEWCSLRAAPARSRPGAPRVASPQVARMAASAVAGALASALIILAVYQPETNREGNVAGFDTVARQEYLLGRHYMSKQNEADIVRAIGHFEEAARIEPTYAAAHAALSNAWWVRGIWGAQTLRQVESASRAAAQQALASNSEPADGWVSLGRIKYSYDRDWQGAEADFRHALALDDDNIDAHYFYAMLLMALGRFPESIAHIERAALRDPLSSMIQSGFGRVLYRARRYDQAIGRLHRAIALEPRNYGALSRLGDVYDVSGRYGEALASYEKARSVGMSEREHRVRRARVYARMGRAGEARRLLEDLEHGSGVPAVGGAMAYAALGDADKAFQLLLRQVDETPMFVAQEDPALDPLRPDGRWKTLMARLKLARSDATDHLGAH